MLYISILHSIISLNPLILNLSYMKIKTLFLTLAVFLSASLTVNGGLIASYEFFNANDENGSDDALPAVFVATSTAGNVTASSFGHGAGFSSITAVGVPDPDYIQITEGNGLQDGIDDDMVGAISLNEYVFFTVTVDLGYSLDLNELTFDAYRAAHGANDYSVRSSVDNYATDISTGLAAGYIDGGITTTRTGQTISLAGTEFDNLTGTTEFRIYFDDRQSNLVR
ncbi:MAG: hypothetical protein NWS71_09190 [Opitutales bacterium]|jgi:hypothetical protein|nr:hypothetical protein [Opitutales bacterium]